MSQIDWSKAPEGATHYDCREYVSPAFMRKNHNGSDWEYFGVHHWIMYGQLSADQEAKLIARPQPWAGEGLPPVGIRATIVDNDPHECYRDHVGADVEILAHTISENDQPVAVYKAIIRGEVFYNALIADRFRPALTAEQVAEEERRRGILQMAHDCGSWWQTETDAKCLPPVFAAMWKAGYRKFEIVEN